MKQEAITKHVALKTMRTKQSNSLIVFISTLWDNNIITVAWDKHRSCVLDVIGYFDYECSNAKLLEETIKEFLG